MVSGAISQLCPVSAEGARAVGPQSPAVCQSNFLHGLNFMYRSRVVES